MQGIEVHILHTTNGWIAYAKDRKFGVILHPEKNAVVRKAVLALSILGLRGIMVIHGLDGRVLESRPV